MNSLRDANRWGGFEGAHIFPLEKETLWNECGFARCITDMDDTTGVSKINSCQNGLLMRGNIHTIFDSHLIAINPDVSDSVETLSSLPNLIFAGRDIRSRYSALILWVSMAGSLTPYVGILQIPIAYRTSCSDRTFDSASLRI